MIAIFGIITFIVGMVVGGLGGFVLFVLVTAIGISERENGE